MLTVVARVLLLADMPVFARARTEDLASLAIEARELEFSSGDEIYALGDSPRGLHVVLRGTVILSREGQETRLGPERAFGTWGLLDSAPRAFDARADGETRLLFVSRQSFLDALADNPELVRGVLESLARSVRDSILHDLRLGEVMDEAIIG